MVDDIGSPPTGVRIQWAVNRDYLRPGEHSLMCLVPENLLTLIGYVVFQWGAFEKRMDATLLAISQSMGRKIKHDLRKQSFDQRSKLFKKIVQEYTREMFPSREAVFMSIYDKALDMHWQRNIIVHGHFAYEPMTDITSPSGLSAAFTAIGMQNGKEARVRIDAPTLEHLRHEISHMTGNMMAELAAMGASLTTSSPDAIVPDSFILQLPQGEGMGAIPVLAIHKKV